MSWRKVFEGWRSRFSLRRRERELDREIRDHLELEAEELRQEGLSALEARRAAHRAFGNAVRIKEDTRRAWGWNSIERFVQDVRFSLRTLRRDLGLTLFAALIVGLGIGAATTLFSVVNAVLLRPLPFDEADRLVWISNIADDGESEWKIQVDHFLDLRAGNRSFSGLAGYFGFLDRGDHTLTGDGEPERLPTALVTENLFPFLGVEPMLGRSFTPEECEINGPRAVMLSFGLWQRRFSSDHGIAGRVITLDGAPVTVVGVLPPSFDFGSVFAPGARIELFAPFQLSPETNRWGNVLSVLGRLKPGVGLDSARAELTAMGQRLTGENPQRNTLRPKLTPLAERISGRFRSALVVLSWAVAVLMLIVCANLSNLQLARLASRRREMAIRIALGAGRLRIVRQVLTESILLSGLGTVLGLLLSVVASRAISRLEAFNIPLLESVRIDMQTFGFSALAAIAAGIVFGLLPALQVPAVVVQGDLKEGGRRTSAGRRQSWTRGALVVAEVALACTLLVGAGLLIRSFGQVLESDLGFRPERLSAVRIDPDQRSDLPRRNAYFDEALRLARSIEGVRQAALADLLPLAGNRSRGVAGQGQVYARDAFPQGFVRVVSEGYFGAMGIPLQAGRDFSRHDGPDSESVVILNEMLAQMLWSGEDPLGRVVDRGGGQPRRVVGIVGNVRHQSLEEGFTGEIYLPIRQTFDYSAVDLLVRSDRSPSALAPDVREALKPLSPNLPLNEWRTLEQLVGKSVSPRRFVVVLLTGFAAFALVLASLGIYAVISYSVSQRTQEIGIRMAMGATAGDLRRRVLGRTLSLTLAGLAIGLAASLAFAQALEGLLYQVAPMDPAAFGAAVLALLAVGLMAGYVPAYRASRLNPVRLLGSE